MQQEEQSQELGIVYFYVSGKQNTRILLATSSPTVILFSRNGTYYTQYILQSSSHRKYFVSSGSLQTPPCLIVLALPSRGLRAPQSRSRSWRPGRGCHCRSSWGQGRPGAQTASCWARTLCSSRRGRARPGRSGRRATRRRRAAAAKREILVKVIQLESLLASFNFLKVSSFSDSDGVEFPRLTPLQGIYLKRMICSLCYIFFSGNDSNQRPCFGYSIKTP